MDVIKMADYVVDLGREGGKEGGNIVFSGTPERLVACKDSYTGLFLKSELKA
jgi:excinuclease ABC subunit A